MALNADALRGFLKRLSMYSFGIALGLIFLAMIQIAKNRSNAKTNVQPPAKGTVLSTPETPEPENAEPENAEPENAEKFHPAEPAQPVAAP